MHTIGSGADGADDLSEAPTSNPIDPVEAALADAIVRASAAGQWTAVETLSRELTARREARSNVVALDLARVRKGRARE